MKIKAKLQSGFGIVGFLFAITILFMLYSFNKFNNSLKFITDVKMKGSMSIANMNTQTSNHMIQAFMHSTTSSESEMAKVEGEIKRLNGIIEAEMKVYEPLMTNDIEKDLFSKFKVDYAEYQTIFNEFLNLSKANKNEEAQNLIKNKLTPIFNKYSSELDAIVADTKFTSEQTKKEIANEYKKIIIEITVVSLIIIVSFVVIIILITKSIVGPVNVVTNSLKDISEGEGDLTRRLDIKSKDEIEVLAKYFNAFVSNLDKIFGDIKKSSESVASASTEISAQMTLVANGVIVQAEKKHSLEEDFNKMRDQMSNIIDSVRNQVAGTEEMSSTITEMSGTINSVSNNTDATMKLSEVSAESAKEGVKIVTEIIESMNKMEQITGHMDKMIEGVQGIAQQTNLLALNAAIEAARAGEAGKGFAVVADEIRKLAETSNKFTDSIAKMVQEIRTAGKVNMSLSTNAGDKLKEIDEKVSRTNFEITDIGKAMEEQAVAVSEVATVVHNLSDASAEIEVKSADQIELLELGNESLEEISRLIDETTASTQETAAASEELSGLAEKLNDLVGSFRTSSI